MSKADDVLFVLNGLENIDLDELEFVEIARLASPGPWRLNAERDEVIAVDDELVATAFALSNNQLRNTAEHIAAWEPSSVLGLVEALRKIIAMRSDAWDRYWYYKRDGEEPFVSESRAEAARLDRVIQALAEGFDLKDSTEEQRDAHDR